MKSTKNPQSYSLKLKQVCLVSIFTFSSFFTFAQPNNVQDVAVNAIATFGQVNDIWQSFTPTQNGRLVQITFDYGAGTPAGTHTMNIYEDEGLDGTLIQSFDISLVAPSGPSTTKVVDLPLPVQVLAGNQYTFSITDINPRTLQDNRPETYTGGILYATFNGTPFTNSDLGFTTILDIGTNVSIESRDEIGATDPFYFDITFYGTPTNLELADFSVTNGTANALNLVSGNNYELEVTTPGDGTVSVDIASGVALVDGLDNDAASASVDVDLPPYQNPELILTNSRLVNANSELFVNNSGINSMVFIAPEGTTHFTTGPTITQGGTVQQCTPQPDMCTPGPDECTMDPMTGMMTCVPGPENCTPQPDMCEEVPGIVAPSSPGEYKLFLTDGSGNATAVSSTTLFVTSESAATTAAIEIDDENILPGETAEVLFLFLGAVTDFTNADLTIPNGTLTDVTSSDGNKSFTATFTPNDDVAEANNTIVLDNTGITDGSTAGTGTTSSNTFAIDTGIPKVTSIQCTDGCDDIYNNVSGSDRTIEIDVNFDRDVILSGTVELELDFDLTNRIAFVTQEAGTQNFTATYELRSGDLANDLDYAGVNALTLRTGSFIVSSSNSNAADLTLPTPGAVGSISENRDIYVDMINPTIVNILRQSPSEETTGADQVIFRVTFSEPMEEASFGANDFSLTGSAAADGTLGTGAMVDPSTYDYTVTGIQNSNGTIGLAYAGSLTDKISNNPISFTTPNTSQSYTMANNVVSFESAPNSSIDQNEEYKYHIQVASSFGGTGLSVSATELPNWLTLTQTDTITNFLETIGGGNNGDGGPVSAARFRRIVDQVYDSEGNLYVLDQLNHRIRVVDTDGIVNAYAGVGTAGFSGDGGLALNAEFNYPKAMAIDSDDNIYVWDQSNVRIRKIDAITKNIMTVAGNGTNGHSGDGGQATSAAISQFSLDLDIASNGELYFLEGSYIRKINLTSGIITTIAGNTTGSSFEEGALATATNISGSGFALDASDNIIISSQRGAIYKVDAETNIITTIAGTSTTGFSGDGGDALSAQFDFGVAGAVAIDNQGVIYVAEFNNRRVRVISLDNKVSTLAGNGTPGSAGDDGPAQNATVRAADKITVGLSGNILLAEDSKLRSVQTNRALLTGTPDNGDVGDNDIELMVSNGLTSKNQSFTLEVADVNDLPEFAITAGELSATQDVLFEIEVASTDVEGDFSEVTVDSAPSWLSATPNASLFTFADGGAYTDIDYFDGSFYLIDSDGAIYTVDELGQNRTFIAGAQSGDPAIFDQPIALAVSSSGIIYLVDQGDHSIWSIDNGIAKKFLGNGTAGLTDGNISTLRSGSDGVFDRPSDIIIDEDDNIYIADTGNGVIRKINLNGSEITTLKDGDGANISIPGAFGLAIDGNGVLYITSNENNTIWSIDGTTATIIAGTNNQLGTADGLGLASLFNEPTGIISNSDGSVLYLTEVGNESIRKLRRNEDDTYTVSTIESEVDTPVGLILHPSKGTLLSADVGYAAIIEAQIGLKLSGTPSSTDVGIIDVSFNVADELDSKTESISFIVQNINDAPIFTSDPSTTDNTVEESSFSYILSATDIDGDALSYTGTTLPDWLILEETEAIVSTFAGNGNNDFVASGSLPTELGIGTVDAVAVDAEGRVFIGTDNRILKVELDNTISILAGDGNSIASGDGNQAINAQIKGVEDLAIGTDGSIYFSTSNGPNGQSYSAIRKIDTDGIITTVAGVYDESFMSTGDGGAATDAAFAGLRGIFVDDDGNIYAADGNDNIIRKIDTDGIINTVATNVSNVFDMVVDKDGNIYAVTDGSTGLLKIDQDDVQSELRSDFSSIRITMDNLGNIYGVTRGTSHIIRYNIKDDSYAVIANTEGLDDYTGDEGPASAATFNEPSGITVGLNGNIFIADNGNSVIRKLTAQNLILTGTPAQGDAGDHNIVLEVSDGLLTDEQSFTQTVLGLPYIIEVTSGINDGFGIGESISFQLGFDENVTFVGSGDLPTITLETGDTDREATWSGGGDGVANIVFTYIVQEGDQSDDLEYSSAELNLGGYTLKSDDDIDSRIELPTIGGGNSLAGTSAIVVDGIIPTLSSVSITSSNTDPSLAREGDVITIDVVASEAIQTPGISINGQSVTVTGDIETPSIHTATYTVTSEDTEGIISFEINYSDIVGNEGDVIIETSDESTVSIDLSSPTVELTTASSDPANSTFDVNITFSEEVNGFSMEDLTLVNATASDFSGDGNSYVVQINPAEDGSVSVDVAADVAADEAGNGNTASNSINIAYDATSPTVELTTASSDPTNSAFDVNITFSEEVNGFSMEDLTLTNATASDFSGNGSSYVVQINPTEDGTVSVSVAADVASDEAGNGNTVSNSINVAYDAINPTVEITTDATDPTNAPFAITITFSEDVTGFEASDLQTDNENGSSDVSNFSGSGSIYTATISPNQDGFSEVVVPSGVAQDAAGNDNNIHSFSIIYDATRPTIEISSEVSSPTNSPFEIDISVSEDLNLQSSDFTITNGTLSDLSLISSRSAVYSYTATITPTNEGSVSVEILGNSLMDAAGNGNVGSNTLIIDYDATSPTVELTTASSDPTNSAFDVIITFNEDVFGFSIEDLTLVNATASDFSGNGSSYVALINPTSDGSVSVDVAADVAADEAGNGNTASNSINVAYDATNPTVELTTASSDPTNSAFDVNITFSEDVFEFSIEDLSLTNATASDFSGEGSSYVVQINPTTDSNTTVSVAADVASDEAGNGNTASNSINVAYDATNPTVELTTASSDPTKSAFDVNITFSEEVTGFSMEDLTLTNATASDFSGNGSSYVVQINPTADGNTTVYVAADVASDEAGNGNTASNSINVAYDATNPTVELTTASSDPTKSAFDVNITFSEEVNGFSIEDLTLVNATASEFSGDGSSYVVQINPTADGNTTVYVAADVAADEAGNGNTESNSIDVAYDETSPTVELTTTSSDPTKSAFDVNITFSEEVNGFSMEDLTLVNATASEFSGDGSSYAVQINPTEDGTVSVSVAADVAADEAGNGNTASNSINVGYDATNPTVELTTTSSDPTNSAFDVNITFSEEVTGFSMEDLTLTNATASDFSGDGSSYVVQINPTTDGSVVVNVAADIASDEAGNGNTASNSINVGYDATNPTVELTTASSDPTNSAFDVNITFSEEVTGFDLTDISVTNGTASNFAGSGSSYTATITATIEGTVSVDIAAGAANDLAGNGNTASNSINVAYDASSPTVELTTTSSDPTNSAFDVNITFSEEVTGFDLTDISVTNGTASNFAGSGSSYTATITATIDGTVSVEIAAGVASDVAGNGNEAANTLSLEADLTNPTVNIATNSSDPTNTTFDITMTFSEEVSGFDLTDISVTNGTASNFAGSGNSYTATITATIDGTVSVEIAAGVASDVAGNGNEAAKTLSVDYRTPLSLFDEIELNVYPNPVSNKLTIKAEQKHTWRLFNLEGKVINENDSLEYQSTIDVSNYEGGLYLIEVVIGSTVIQKKIKIKH